MPLACKWRFPDCACAGDETTRASNNYARDECTPSYILRQRVYMIKPLSLNNL